MAALTAKRLREVLRYNRRTGVFTWTTNLRRGQKGKRAGGMRAGRRGIGIDGRRYLASRLAWLYVKGSWPTHEIDHKNLDKSDDRFSNLRPATHAQNLRNVGRLRNNSSGIKGVTWDKSRRKWSASITVDGRQYNLGRFASLKAARAKRRSAATELHGEFGRAA